MRLDVLDGAESADPGSAAAHKVKEQKEYSAINMNEVWLMGRII